MGRTAPSRPSILGPQHLDAEIVTASKQCSSGEILVSSKSAVGPLERHEEFCGLTGDDTSSVSRSLQQKDEQVPSTSQSPVTVTCGMDIAIMSSGDIAT